MKHILLILFIITGLHRNSVAYTIELSFDFSNYVEGTQPDQIISNTGTEFDNIFSGMLYQDIASGSSYNIDAILSSTTDYLGKYSMNGAVGSDIQINQQWGQTVEYNLSLFEAGTTNLFDLSQFEDDFNYSLTLYDIDGAVRNGNRTETISFLNEGDFQLTTTSTVDQIGEATFANQFVGNVPNPVEGADELTAQQEDASVITTFTNQNSIDFIVTTGAQSSGNRNFFIDGGDFVEFNNSQAAPGAPTPSIYALCSLGLVFIIRSKLQKLTK